MDLCSNGHSEVCYDSRECPACEYYEETKQDYENQIEALENKLAESVEEVNDLAKQLKERNNQ